MSIKILNVSKELLLKAASLEYSKIDIFIVNKILKGYIFDLDDQDLFIEIEEGLNILASIRKNLSKMKNIKVNVELELRNEKVVFTTLINGVASFKKNTLILTMPDIILKDYKERSYERLRATSDINAKMVLHNRYTSRMFKISDNKKKSNLTQHAMRVKERYNNLNKDQIEKLLQNFLRKEDISYFKKIKKYINIDKLDIFDHICLNFYDEYKTIFLKLSTEFLSKNFIIENFKNTINLSEDTLLFLSREIKNLIRNNLKCMYVIPIIHEKTYVGYYVVYFQNEEQEKINIISDLVYFYVFKLLEEGFFEEENNVKTYIDVNIENISGSGVKLYVEEDKERYIRNIINLQFSFKSGKDYEVESKLVWNRKRKNINYFAVQFLNFDKEINLSNFLRELYGPEEIKNARVVDKDLNKVIKDIIDKNKK